MGVDDDAVRAADEAQRRLREAVGRQLGVERPPAADVDSTKLVRFADVVDEPLDDEEQRRLEDRARQLDPWLQGPFLLGGDLVIGGAWRNDHRWMLLGEKLPEDLSGLRVLDVGSNAGYDPFMLNLRGAEYVLACEPYQFHEQAVFLESIYRTGVDFRQIGWQQLDPSEHGSFDLLHCHGVLYHEPHPLLLLQRLRAMVAPGAALYFGSMMLADPALSEYARYVPCSYYGDETWWWVPGRLVMRWLLETAGFAVEEEFGEHQGPPGDFAVVNGYFRARPAEPLVPADPWRLGPPPSP